MSTHQEWLVMFSFILLLRSAVSYYQDNSWDSDIDDIDEQNEAPADGVNWKSNDDIYNSYPDNMKDVLLLKENPQLYLVTSMNRQRDNMARLTAQKRMTMVNNNSIKDATHVPGKPSLSIISPLEALQRKVAVVYNIRQKERNRGLLNNYGKRSLPNTYRVLDPEQIQNDAVLQSEIEQLKQVPRIPRRKLYNFYRVP